MPPLCETMSGGGYVSSSYWRSMLSGNKPRAIRACIKNQRYGIHSSLKSALKCIKVYMQKMISKFKDFWYQELNTWPIKRVHEDMMVRALMCILSSHCNNIRNPVSEYHFSWKIKMTMLSSSPFLSNRNHKNYQTETINTLLPFKKKCDIIHI